MASQREDLPENTTLTHFNNTTVDTLWRNWLGFPIPLANRRLHTVQDSIEHYTDDQVRLCLFRLYERRVDGWYVDQCFGGLWLDSWLLESFADKAHIVKSRLVDDISKAIHQWHWEQDFGFTKYTFDDEGEAIRRPFKVKKCSHVGRLIKHLVQQRFNKNEQCYNHSIGLNQALTNHGNECDQNAIVPDSWQDTMGDYGLSVQWTDE